jgi:hypothetical protein
MTQSQEEDASKGILFQNFQHYQIQAFCPGFSECRVFSVGMKIVIDKNLENTIWQCFGRLSRFLNYIL